MSTFSGNDQENLEAACYSPAVDGLLGILTLDEKVSLLHGSPDPESLGQAGYIIGVPRLDIPGLRLCDGPAGVNVKSDATCLPSPVSTAATFSPELANQYGAVLGREARTLGQDMLLAPQIDIVRVPQFTRSKDMPGEDPYLIGQIAAAYVEGIQCQGVMAQAKHFIANNQAHGQAGPTAMDFQVDDRALHEIYLVGFEWAVRSGVAGIMAAYNHINGLWNSESPATLIGLLRHELGFAGFVCSDWGATHSVSVDKGLDVQMPDGSFFGEPLKQAVESGTISVATLDRAVRRVLGQMEAFGLLDGSRQPAPSRVDVAAGARTAREVAAAGAVLLSNDGTLPLSKDGALPLVGSLAVIGPTATQLAAGLGGERAYGFPDRLVSPLDALRRTAVSSDIRSAVGVDLTGVAVPSNVLVPEGGSGQGLTRTTSDGATTVDATVDFTDHSGHGALPSSKTYTWTGTITGDHDLETETGDDYYDLKIQSWGGAGSLELDGKKVATSAVSRDGVVRPWTSLLPTTDGLDNGQVTVKLCAGEAHQICITGTASASTELQIRLAWVTPKQRHANMAEAVRLAGEADTAVVFAFDGVGGNTAGSAGDRTTLSLPNQQDELISAVAAEAANRKTKVVVVLNTGWPVTMPWLPKVQAVLQMWYPGQEGGWATADLLLGNVSPSGKLPVTFPARDTDTPGASAPERYQGVDGVVRYSEGIFVGYRWYDHQGIKPLFPFGHGLSYTSFHYSDLTVCQVGDGLKVCFTVRNIGSHAGAEVPQVYVGPPNPVPLPMASQVLAGFQRIELASEQKKRVTIRVDARQLSYWSTVDRRWVVATGPRPVYVGSSSRDIRLSQVGLLR